MIRARLDFDPDAAIDEIALQYGYIVEEAARIRRAEIRALLREDDSPSTPGSPPHSTGELRDSFHSTRARRKGDLIVAYTTSDLMAGEIPLAVLLDAGWESGGPFPFLDQADLNTEHQVDLLIQQANRP